MSEIESRKITEENVYLAFPADIKSTRVFSTKGVFFLLQSHMKLYIAI